MHNHANREAKGGPQQVERTLEYQNLHSYKKPSLSPSCPLAQPGPKSIKNLLKSPHLAPIPPNHPNICPTTSLAHTPQVQKTCISREKNEFPSKMSKKRLRSGKEEQGFPEKKSALISIGERNNRAKGTKVHARTNASPACIEAKREYRKFFGKIKKKRREKTTVSADWGIRM